MFFLWVLLGNLVSLGAATVAAQDPDLQQAIETIKQVDVGGQGHDQAVKAVAILNRATAADVPVMLQGMQDANVLALNWLRGGVQSALQQGPLPRKEIEDYWRDPSGSSMGRLMAFELLADADPAFAEKHLAEMLDDPSLPLRQLAVAHFIQKAGQAGNSDDAIGMLAQALPYAREVEQMSSIAQMLGDRGIEVNLQKQLGVIASWAVVGPFDNTNEEGFDKVLGPESDPGNVDLSASYEDSKTGQPITWQRHNTLDPSGVVDLNALLAEEKGVIAYAFAEFDSPEEQDVDIRIGCINGNKVWVNGNEIINNEIHHVGMMTDQFRGRATFKKGANQILFKICQNEQTQPWANRWMFQLRVCEADGKAVLPVAAAAQE